MSRSAVVLCTFLLTTPAMAETSLSLVHGGDSAATIVITSDAPDTVARAANELQEYVERSTGARLPILEGERPDAGLSILVGESRFTAELGIALNDG